jgi:Na+/melibiose symporter-like transporter
MAMSLNNPDARRALRSVVQAVVALVVVFLVGVIIHFLRNHPQELYGIGIGCLVIVGIGTLLYGAENVTRAVKFKGPLGVEGSIGDEPVPVTVQNPPSDPVPVAPTDATGPAMPEPGVTT